MHKKKLVTNNFHKEKMGVIKFIIEQFEKNANTPKGKKYIS